MKKSLILLFFIFIAELFSENYKIDNITFEIEGKTKQNNLLTKFPINKEQIFSSENDFNFFVEDYKTKLSNLRAFEQIEIEKQLINEKEDIKYVNLIIKLKEGFSFLALPYFKYDSNTGSVIKVKVKDNNFFGTLNPMNFDLNYQMLREDDLSPYKHILGSNFSFDYPFNLGILNTTLVNNYSITYTFGQKLPEWNALLGLKFELPLKSTKLCLDLNQYAIRNDDYIYYNDEIYFTEQASVYVPITLFKTQKFSNITYTPLISFTYNWDNNHINENNFDLSGPALSFGHSINLGQVNWNENFRKGLLFTINNTYTYNFQKNDFVPYINLQINAHWNFINSTNWFLKRLGINTKLYTFLYIPLKNNKYYYGEQYGGFLRGIRDEQYFNSDITEFAGEKALSSFTAFTLCLDFPIKLFTTNFTKSFLRYFNFELQIAPFMDISLGYNRYTKRYFHPKDGFYTAGMEILVYPQKWSSFTVRGSLGIDMGRFLNIVDYSWRSNISLYEFSFGIGLHY